MQIKCLRRAFMVILVVLLCTSCNAPKGVSRSTPIEPSTIHPISEPTEEEPENVAVTKWALVPEIPFGFAGTPTDNIYSVTAEPIRIDSRGGELLFRVTPATDPNCTQIFRVSWDFAVDIGVVHEGDTISLVLHNKPDAAPGNLLECYINSKGAMQYGGELGADFHVSGTSHFLEQPRYMKYQEGDSQYLFAPGDICGGVYPAEAGFGGVVGGGIYSFTVRDGIAVVGEMDAPHGNITIRVVMGAVFIYDVTYLYDAVR